MSADILVPSGYLPSADAIVHNGRLSLKRYHTT